MWYVYIVKCFDETYYTGITTDIDRRINEHNSGKGAKYTRSRIPVQLEEFKEFKNRSEASQEEARIKKLSRADKERLIGEWRIERLMDEHVLGTALISRVLPSDILIQFNSPTDGRLLGQFKEESGKLTFEGDVSESGKLFTDFIVKSFNERLKYLNDQNNN
jgi:putative endonuclease